jgi:membrane-associated phospholipid phosphatase
VLDPLAGAVGIGVLGSAIGGPAVAYGLESIPPAWRRTAEWVLIGGALLVAVAAGLLPVARWQLALVYVLAALPGVIAFIASRTLLASMLVSLAPLYFVIGDLTRGRIAYAPELALDRAVALRPAWMLVYGSLYVFVVVLPLVVVRERELGHRAMRAYLMVMTVSYLGFLVFPTVGPRPGEVPADGFSAWSLRAIYSIDPPHGCFPSLHVAYSFVSALTCYRVHRRVGLAAALWAALIGVSTLYTKQHYVVDVIAGALLGCVAYILFLRTHPRDSITESGRRSAPFRASCVAGIYTVMVAGFWIAYRLQLP